MKYLAVSIGLLCALAASAADTRVAVLDVQGAILSTQEGRKAVTEFDHKFELRKSQLQVRRDHIQSLEDKLRRGDAVMSADAKSKLAYEIRASTTAWSRDVDDLNAEMQDEHDRLLQSLGAKLREIVQKYATQNGYTVVLDGANADGPVFWAAASANITDDVVKQYDRAYPPASPAPTSR